MTRPRLIRGLRIAWSVWWGILCVLLIVLWVRSYSWSDEVYTQSFYFDSDNGLITSTSLVGSRPPAGLYSLQTDADALFGDDLTRLRDCHWIHIYQFQKRSVVSVPHWLFLLLSAITTGAPWILRRFSLRTLLIATTLIAVVLGLVVIMWH